jgi:ubiquinone/menaquinone biosynthesis C-methylase UbiE
MTTIPDRDYVLGTHDDEIARLGLQHNVWRPYALAAWQHAGFNVGQTILDIGCGPGYATLDLAELVGPRGKVRAVDRSRRFLDTLEARRDARGLTNISTLESDLDDLSFQPESADAAWARWVLAFVMRPRDLLARVAHALKPGGVFVSHEYFDYAAWRTLPRSAMFEEFVTATIVNWRSSGGEPDVGAEIPRWLEELDFEIESVKPLIFVITPRDYMWQWPTSFMDVGLKRLVDLGAIDPKRGEELAHEMRAITTSDRMRMITPGLVEIIARKRS